MDARPSVLRCLSHFWTETLFAGGIACADAKRPAWHLLVLLLLAGFFFLARPGCPLLEPEEARYAEIPRQMLRQGALVIPVLHGEPYLHKPPLLYWLLMALYRIGNVSDSVARLLPAGCGILTVVLSYCLLRRPLGSHGAFLGALILCLSPRFLYLERMLTLDGLLCLWVTVGWWAGYQALGCAARCWSWWLISAAATGLGLLTKGPVALALVVPPLLLWQLLERRAVGFRWRMWLAHVGLALLLAAPWYLAVAWLHPAAVVDFFWLHNVVRYAAPFDHVKPLWFYLGPLLVGMLPGSLLLLPMIRDLWRHTPATAPRRPAVLGFLLLASGWSLLFFSLAGCKRAVYILPVLPPLALALGCWLDRALEWQLVRLPWLGWCRLPHRPVLCLAGLTAWVMILALAATLLLPEYHRRFSLRGQVRRHQELCRDHVPVICYPKRWDSVSFYLDRDDVRVFGHNELAELLALLQRHPRCLLFLKNDASLSEVLAALPAGLEWVPLPDGRTRLCVGIVQRRESGTGK